MIEAGIPIVPFHGGEEIAWRFCGNASATKEDT
jgi:hypothetical protein